MTPDVITSTRRLPPCVVVANSEEFSGPSIAGELAEFLRELRGKGGACQEKLEKEIAGEFGSIFERRLGFGDGAEAEEEKRMFALDLSKFFAQLLAKGQVVFRPTGERMRAEEAIDSLAEIADQQLELVWEFWQIRRGFTAEGEEIRSRSREALHEFYERHPDLPEGGILAILMGHISGLYPDRGGIGICY